MFNLFMKQAEPTRKKKRKVQFETATEQRNVNMEVLDDIPKETPRQPP